MQNTNGKFCEFCFHTKRLPLLGSEPQLRNFILVSLNYDYFFRRLMKHYVLYNDCTR